MSATELGSPHVDSATLRSSDRGLSDRLLLASIAAGDRAALAELARRHLPAARALILDETGDEALTDRLAAEVVGAIRTSARRYHADGLTAEPWVLELTRRRLAAHRRRGRASRVESPAGLALLATIGVALLGLVTLNSGAPAPAAGPAAARPTVARPATAAGHVQPLPPPSSAPLGAPAAPLASFAVRSFTAISDRVWWLLGQASCGGGQCLELVRSTDGGAHFTRVGPAPADGATDLRFADQSDGYAYGPDLYSTHDGGRSWRAVGIGGVSELAISGGRVFAVATPPTQPGPARLYVSPVGTDSWTADPAAGAVAGGLWVRLADVLVQSADRRHLEISRDGGATFLSVPAPPGGHTCRFQEMAPPALWALCGQAVWRSPDGGAVFEPVSAPPASGRALLAAASADGAVYGGRGLYITGDSGGSWSRLSVPASVSGWDYVAFTDAVHGVALGGGRFYRTADGGRSYQRVAVPLSR